MMSDETTLADLLALNLHKVEDEVRNIVDKATKELSMEKTLKVCRKYGKMLAGALILYAEQPGGGSTEGHTTPQQ